MVGGGEICLQAGVILIRFGASAGDALLHTGIAGSLQILEVSRLTIGGYRRQTECDNFLTAGWNLQLEVRGAFRTELFRADCRLISLDDITVKCILRESSGAMRATFQPFEIGFIFSE